jgi:outer membrane protein assembly factor BamB
MREPAVAGEQILPRIEEAARRLKCGLYFPDCRRQPEAMHTLPSLMTLMFLGGFATAALSAETQLAWPQFRGPNGSGVAEGQKPPVEFGPDKNVKWKIPVPAGLSSPIVAGDKLILTAFDDGKLQTIAYDRATGREAWRATAPAKQIEAYHKTEGSPAASTPATDGTRIVSYFGSCGLVAYDLSGKQLWTYEMPPAATPGDFGSGVSPIIADGTVILVRDEMKDPKVVALDAATGALKWQNKRLSAASYCTPVIWDTPAGKQIVAAGHVRMVGYQLSSGAEKWFYNGLPSGCCTSPVTADGTLYFAGWAPGGPDDTESQMPTYDGMLKDLDKDKDGALSRDEAEKAFGGFFDTQDTNKDGKVTRDEWDAIIKFMSEGKNSAFALKPGGSGDVTESHVLWKKTKGLPYVASALVYRGQYVTVKDGGIVAAFDAKTGDEIYLERAVVMGKYYSSPVAANGNIYFTTLDDGAITVLKAGTTKPEVVSKNPKLGERTSATPAIADNTLYVRTEKHLYAFSSEK